MKLIHIACAFSLTIVTQLQANPDPSRTAVVDMKRVFAEYSRTKEAEQEINDRKAQAKRELDERTARYKTMLEQYQTLRLKVQDEALTPDLRETHRQEATRIGQEAKSLERQITEFRQRRERQLQEQVIRIRKTILEEINEHVIELAKTSNVDRVFDSSGLSLNGVGFLLYSRATDDISDQIIARINREKS